MKYFKIPLIGLITLIITSGFQNKSDKVFIVYFEDYELQAVDTKAKKTHQLGYHIQPEYNDLHHTDNLVFTASEMGIEMPGDMLFYMGFTSPYQNEIIYTVTEKFDPYYQVFLYNKSSNKKTLLLQTSDGPDNQLAFIPFGFTDNPNMIYIEAVNLESQEEHQGIWTFNIESGEFQKLSITDKYMMRPLISPDRKELFYTATSNENHRDVVHGIADKILKYQTKNKAEYILTSIPKKQLNIQGLFIDEIGKLKFSKEDATSSFKTIASGYKLPWNSGDAFCITRDGTPRPPISTLNNGGVCGYVFNQHGYEALDFSNLYATGQYKQDNVRASKEGEVIYTGYEGCSCSYGNLVKLLHDDDLISYYAHLSSISVSVGDCVGQGEIIGKEGGSGDECNSNCEYGEHLHFEVRTSNARGTQVWITFDEYGQTTRQNDLATSDNTYSSCGTPPPIDGGNCQPNIITTTETIPANTYEASNTITSTGTISSGTINFKSPSISLNNGFEVSDGIFYAENVGCSNNKIKQPDKELSTAFSIYPNPFSKQTNINFSIVEDQPVSIWINDISGRLISKIVDSEVKTTGQHQITFNADNNAVGIYYVTMQTGENFATQKMIINK